MAQNIYDNPQFFTEYSKLLRSQRGLAGAPEWPYLRQMVGDVTDSSVLDLGCGFGWFCRWAKHDGGARTVRGVDVSEKMLAKAREWEREGEDGGGILYEQADLDLFSIDAEDVRGGYDVVFSSLALHYLSDLDQLFRQIFASLKPGGRFVFSVEHPIFTAPIEPKPGWWQDGDGPLHWPLNSYGKEGLRVTKWLADGVRKQHRTIETYVTLLLGAGFRITGLREWMPNEEDLVRFPEWERAIQRPTFLLVGVIKD